jgi:hypothetical protein
MVDLHGVKVKQARVHAHLEAVERICREVTRPDAYELVAKEYAEGREHRFYVEAMPAIPDDLSSIIGDVLYNARAALDHLAWRLVEAAGNTPVWHGRGKTMFPICLDPPPGRLYVGGGVSDDAMRLIKAFQPYEGGHAACDALGILHELHNVDKHRELLVAATAIDIAFYGVPGGVKAPVGIVTAHALEHGMEVGRFIYESKPDVRVNPQFEYVVKLRPRADVDRRVSLFANAIDGMLRFVAEQVDGVIVALVRTI